MDEALGLPTEKAATIALRTQQILACETGVADTVDPLGGSYALEAITSALEAKAREYLEAIDRVGGTVRAIEAGFQQREIQDAAFRCQVEMERGDRQVVGLNRFTEDAAAGAEGPSVPIHRIDERLEGEQRERLRALRSRRDDAACGAALAEIERLAATEGNLMPAILRAVEASATVGEISDRMRRAFGAYRARDRI
jgi:methylmalonyl-CoA mutase N-terminal domain/subunit